MLSGDQVPSARITVVDDDPDTLALLNHILGARYSVDIYRDGNEALEWILNAEPPDLILSDIMMPGMDGRTLCKKLRLRWQQSELPILLLSALELVVLAAVATFFASVAGPVAAMLYGFGAFLAGHTMSDILAASAGSTTGISSVLLKALGWVIPDLSRFDMRLHAVHGVTIPAGEIGWAALYALLYSAALLCLASAVFARREFR